MDSGHFLEHFLTAKFIATVVLVLLLMGLRYGLVLYIRRSTRKWTSQQRLKWIGTSRTLISISVFLGVILLWGETIQGFAVSVFAIAFAIVFSVKELCMCFNGSLVRLRGKSFEVGDRIHIGKIRGDVIETTLLSTTVQEVKSHLYTGKTITFPNSLFLSEPVQNESFLESFYLLHIEIPVKMSQGWKEAKATLLRIAQEESVPYLQQAKLRRKQLERRLGLEMPSVEPRVTLQITGPEDILLELRMTSPTHLKERLEQVIVNRYLEEQTMPPGPRAETISPKPHLNV